MKIAFLSITKLPKLFNISQQQDEERRRQLRERARQLIAEARSGVKMSELPSYNEVSADRLKERAKTSGGELKDWHASKVPRHLSV